MKTHIALLMTALILVSGCRTNDTSAIEVESVANTAAWVGTVEHLKRHPKDAPLFVAAHTKLGELIDGGTNATPAQLASALHELPIKELKGPYGTLIAGAGGFILYKGSQRVAPDGNVHRIAVAVRDGIGSGLKQSQ